MADNTTNAVGDVIAADEVTIGGVAAKVQRIKPGFGADGVWNEVAIALPLPVMAIPATDLIQAGTSQLVPKWAAIDIAGSQDLIALVGNKQIMVLSAWLSLESGNNDGTLKFQSGASSDLTGTYTTEGNIILPFNQAGWFETVASEKLNAVLGGTSPVLDGVIQYVEK